MTPANVPMIHSSEMNSELEYAEVPNGTRQKKITFDMMAAGYVSSEVYTLLNGVQNSVA
jgi:hypothetical protein